ncbi:unnamed protein product [Ambrosiozyma monospora]|uniref:Unnamed protein product n=1 Tax=Ambrosiozyma monospora TaxID=43982 RepID=A0ACB5U4P3_AMBMO|nr:unnamed protein product [Ambrosiozyma monospora]
MTPLEIESHLLDAANRNILSVKIDHQAGVASFKASPFEDSFSFISTQALVKEENPIQLTASELVRLQLSNLAKTLSASVKLIDPSIKEKKAIQRQEALKAANAGFAAEKEDLLSRQHDLDTRKERLAEIKRKEEEAAAKEKQEKFEAAKKAEKERAEQEAIKRAEEKRAKLLEAASLMEKKKVFNEINSKGIIKVDMKDIKNLSIDDVMKQQLEKLEKDNTN